MDDAATEAEQAAPPPRRSWRRRGLRALGWTVGGLIALFSVIVWGIDTGPGHRLIADRIAAMKPSSGLRIRIGRIDGSLWSNARLRDVRLYDSRGRFFEAPEIKLAWHPFAWARNKLDIDTLSADLIILDRLPKLKPGRPGAPILPGFDIRIGKLAIGRLRLGPAVSGSARAVRIAASADIHAGRAMIKLDAFSDAGDKIQLDLDAIPDGDRFKLAAHAVGPSGGVLGGLIGTRRPLLLTVGGSGGWHVWNGTAKGTLSGIPDIDLALGVRDGHYLLKGMVAPSPFVHGKLQRLSAPRILVSGDATLAQRKLAGRLELATPALLLATHGTIDLATGSFDALKIDANLRHPPALFPNMTGQNVRLALQLDGPFATAHFRYALTSPHIAFDQTGFDRVSATGAGQLSKAPIAVPIRLTAARVTGIGTVAGGILANLGVSGVLHVDAKTLVGNDLALTSDKLKGKLVLRLDLVTGRYDVAVTGGLARYLIPGLGIVDVQTKVSVLPGPNGVGTIVTGTGQAIVRRFDNAFLRSLAGGNPRIDTHLMRDTAGIIHFSNLVLTGPSIRITGAGIRRRDGSFQFEGSGRQATYGAFRITLDGQIDHPKVRLLFDRPVESLGLDHVQLDLDPAPQGFDFHAAGGSTVGPFQAHGAIRSTPGQPTTIDIAALDVTGTHSHGSLRSDPGGFTGQLDVAGGGIGGAIGFAPAGMIQRIEPHLTFTGATLATAMPIVIRRGRLDGTILLDPAGVAIDGKFSGFGLRRGNFSLARANLTARLTGGRGVVAGTVAGAGARSFEITATANLEPGRVSVIGQGQVEHRPIKLASPAVLTMEGDDWALASTRIDYSGGAVTLAGRFAKGTTEFDAALEHMPLSVLDIFNPKLALGGAASGKLSFRHIVGTAPTGRVDATIRGLTRSGLVLSSQPVDVGLAAVLTANGAAARAVVASGGKTIGRAQARIAPLAPGDDILSRLQSAPLFAQLRYVGPADTLWRLVGVETIDLSGPISVAADIGGTPADPQIRGQLATDNGRLESATIGTVVSGIKARGRFGGSRLVLDSMSGRTPGGGTLTGTGSFEFGAGKGLGINLALQAAQAQILNLDSLGATITGALTIKSDGRGGTIGGDVVLDRSRYRLGAAASAQVPHLAVTEINRPEAEEEPEAPPVPWNLDLKARARNRLMVTGLGLDSEWRADLTIKGSVDNPAIGGRADLVRGGYEFAGRRFDLQRGIIRFTGIAPPDPILDISAQANIQDVNASIQVVGTGTHPEIHFESVPALPEDELLSRLLFGTSITNLSAPEALQLAAAVASLRTSGGSGLNLDPINAVRKAVRLDRLRILPADVTTGQKTAIAAGKYIGRRTYVELITDGAGYSATSVEFRITRWLSLLSTISTIGRQSANVKISKDY